MKQYKLLKDLPGIPAGTIGEEKGVGLIFFKSPESKSDHWNFEEDCCRRHPDFFHDMDTPEPETSHVSDIHVGEIPEKQGEPPIGELLAILQHTGKVVIPGHPEAKIYRVAGDLLASRLGIHGHIFQQYFEPFSEPEKEGIR